MKKIVYQLSLILMVSLLAACIPLTPQGPLGKAEPIQAAKLPVRIWVKDLSIADPIYSNADSLFIGRTLSQNLQEYLNRCGYFQEAKLAPGQYAKDDLFLKFRFTQLNGRQSSLLPITIPLTFLSFGLYPLSNAPLSYDSIVVAGELRITNSQNIVLSTSQAAKRTSAFIGLYDESDTRTILTEVVGELLAKAVPEAQKKLAK